jgi:hypothetical protein
MKKEPIPGLSDQRYFHIALLSRKKGLSLNWIWEAMERDARLKGGRLPSLTSRGVKYECRTIAESPLYAGSPEAVRELATSGTSGTCDYDVVGIMAGDLVMFGTGYSRLTHDLAKRLVRHSMMGRGWFLRPRLNSIAEMFQKPTGAVAKRAAQSDVALYATGVTAIYRGSKNFRGMRFSGADVFGEGFIEMVAGWLENNAEKATVGGEMESIESSFGYNMMRLNAVDRLTGGSASLTMRPDGSYKVWLRKGAANLPDFCSAIRALVALGLVEEKADVPKWAEDDEL